MKQRLLCMTCGSVYAANQPRIVCDCGGLLDVTHDLLAAREAFSRGVLDQRHAEGRAPYNSGVWRYRELILDVKTRHIVSRPEGNTPAYRSPTISRWVGLDDFTLKHEGENPTGSFKDRGMTVGVTQAVALGAQAVACASTGNTSASMASYAALAELRALVFIPEGQIAHGKLAQALAYGARTLQIRGDFDAAMTLVRQVCRELGVYLLNSLNPFRVEGQKSIIFELLQQRRWRPPDWVVFPAGNLGNCAAFGKALYELREMGFISRLPRLAAVQAHGANPFFRSYLTKFDCREDVAAETIATAIRIGHPMSYERAVRSLRWTDGVVTEVSDQEILDAKAQVDRAGLGCEPASAAAVAGARRLVAEGVIKQRDAVVSILTGHLLKDPGVTVAYHLDHLEGIEPAYANLPTVIDPTVEAVQRVLEEDLS